MMGPLLPGERSPRPARWDGLAIRDGGLWVRFGTHADLLEVIGHLPPDHDLRRRLVAVAELLAG